MNNLSQELMTPHEAARWFRRSPSWLRQQADLLRLRAAGGQPLFHVAVCRAYVLGRLCGLESAALRELQIRSLTAACGLPEQQELLARLDSPSPEEEPRPALQEAV